MTDKLLEFVFSGKIKTVTYYPDLSLLILGFKDGKIEVFNILIEPETQKPSFTSRSTNANLLVTKSFQQVKGSCF